MVRTTHQPKNTEYLMSSRCVKHRAPTKCLRPKRCPQCWATFNNRLNCRIHKLRLKATELPLTLTKIRFRKCTIKTLQIKLKQVEEPPILTKRPDINSYKTTSMALVVLQWWRQQQLGNRVSRERELTVQCIYNKTIPTQRTTCQNYRISTMLPI